MTKDIIENNHVEIDLDESYVLNVEVKYTEGKWWAKCNWTAGSYLLNNNATLGTIETKHFSHSLEEAIDLIMKRKDRFQIKDHPIGITLMYLDEKFPPPANAKELMEVEAQKRGWEAILDID